MPTRQSFGIDSKIALIRHATPTTIRQEQSRKNVILRRDTLGWMADIEQVDTSSVSFPISEASVKILIGG
jgi:hypothetical protein